MTTETKDSREGKYLTFVLGNEEYGIDALKVEGILSLQSVTPIPGSPHYMKGVATVRGRVTPVIGVRTRLGMSEVEDTPETCIILVSLGDNRRAGMIVDTVRDVIDIPAVEIEEPITSVDPGGEVVGLAKNGDRVKILLDIDAVLGEVATLSAGAE